MIIINPGTERQDNATLENANESLKRFLHSLDVPDCTASRLPDNDGDGWFGYKLTTGHNTVTVDIPGIDPDVVQKGEPWVSPRLYVDGSSWLWGYALDIAHDHLLREAA